MKVRITERGTKSYYDEFIYIAYFVKKFMKRPWSRTHRMTHYLITSIFVVILALFLELYFYKIYNDGFMLFVVGVLTLLLLYHIIYLFMVIKRIGFYKSDNKDVTFSLEKDGVLYESEDLNINLKWENIKYVIVGKYSIVFIPVSIKYAIISISVDYKNEFVEGLKKYKKENLLIERKIK